MIAQTGDITEAIVEELKKLPPEQQQQILDFVEYIADKYAKSQFNQNQPPKKRIAELHKGKIWMSDDFNDPLPDEFWGFE
jgi:mRNA-degrading endonuclease RelE of RelBE toxin-antitoxin system